jgi:hypothetical protein
MHDHIDAQNWSSGSCFEIGGCWALATAQASSRFRTDSKRRFERQLFPLFQPKRRAKTEHA